jgi:hypothetical protein
MENNMHTKWILGVFVAAMLSVGVAGANDSATVAEQIGGLQQMCADTAEARAQRQADQPLYERLGGYDRIHEFVREVVRLHFENDALDRIMVGVDGEKLAKNVADFAASGTGGPQTYTGRDMPSAHAHLELTDADFLWRHRQGHADHGLRPERDRRVRLHPGFPQGPGGSRITEPSTTETSKRRPFEGGILIPTRKSLDDELRSMISRDPRVSSGDHGRSGAPQRDGLRRPADLPRSAPFRRRCDGVLHGCADLPVSADRSSNAFPPCFPP